MELKIKKPQTVNAKQIQICCKEKELSKLLNKYCCENESNTPDKSKRSENDRS